MTNFNIRHEDNIHLMLDMETYSIQPHFARISSICIKQFSLSSGSYGYSFRAVLPDIRTGATVFMTGDPDTRIWREENDIDKVEANLNWPRLSTPEQISNAFGKLVKTADYWKAAGKQVFLWAKPASFDIAILRKYFYEHNHLDFWHRRNEIDLNTFIRSRGFDPDWLHAKTLQEHQIPNNIDGEECPWPQAHNAEFDVDMQIKAAMFASLYSPGIQAWLHSAGAD